MNYDQFDTFVEDLLGEKNNRPIVIIGASKIDDLLYRILNKFLLPKSSSTSQNDELLEGDNPLGTFSARIKMTYRLGLIDHELFKILERIRSIRNKSAHSIEFKMRKSPIREYHAELKRLVINRTSFIKTRERYFREHLLDETKELQCIMITICVLLEAINDKVVKTPGNSTTLNISNK